MFPAALKLVAELDDSRPTELLFVPFSLLFATHNFLSCLFNSTCVFLFYFLRLLPSPCATAAVRRRQFTTCIHDLPKPPSSPALACPTLKVALSAIPFISHVSVDILPSLLPLFAQSLLSFPPLLPLALSGSCRRAEWPEPG